MIFNQYYLDCLSHASYLVGDEASGEAAVVDPQRDVSAYRADAEAAGLRVRYVIETHLHADFLSGHLELADRTGAEICYGEAAETDFPSRKLADGERISLGAVGLEVRATPGHTPESISIVVYEHEGDPVPYGVLTGDTLFIGDVGRPDLLAAAGMSPDDMARQLYRSLGQAAPPARRHAGVPRARRGLGVREEPVDRDGVDDRRTAPDQLRAGGHGRGCLRRHGDRGPAGQPALLLLRRHPEPRGACSSGRAGAAAALDLEEVLALQRDGAAVLDTRQAFEYAAGHLAGSVNVGLEGRFAEYVGEVVEPRTLLVLVSDDGTELEARVRLAPSGSTTWRGYLRDPVRRLPRASRCDRARLAPDGGRAGGPVGRGARARARGRSEPG